jgi:tetratricopeptide (TPR) repeat protein
MEKNVSTPTDIFRLAVAHHSAGRLAEAEALYREILAADPSDAAALNNLGLIAGKEEAIELFSRAISINPGYRDALVNLAGAMRSQGNTAEAIRYFEKALEAAPGDNPIRLNLAILLQAEGKLDRAEIHYAKAAEAEPGNIAAVYNLGTVLQAQGKCADAIRAYERAIALKPDFVEALCNLATVHATERNNAAASKWYRWALTLDPSLSIANQNMVSMLEADGRLAEAGIFRSRAPRPHPFMTETAPEPRRTVLVLSTLGSGNIPIELLLPRQTTTRIKWYADYATDEQAAALPYYDVAFNAIGNADITAPSHARLEALYRREPFLNAPAAVENTRRDRMPALMAGIPGVVVPQVARLRRDEVLCSDLEAKLAVSGVRLPFIIRPLSTQGGGGMELIKTSQQLAEHTYSDSDAFYFINFLDYLSADGYYRKYRLIFVDRKVYPYHLAISKKWLVHYFSADMMSDAWKRDEEHRFLADPAAAIGAQAMAAIEAIGRRMDLDYAGIDCTVLPDGRVAVFEANATMSLHLFEPVQDYPYKYIYVPRIAQAFEAMLARHERNAGVRNSQAA